MKDNEQLQYENEQLAQGNNKLWTQLEKSAEILSHHEAYISLLEEQNAEIKELLKECQKYIETMYSGAKNCDLDSFSDIAYHIGIELLTKIDGVLK